MEQSRGTLTEAGFRNLVSGVNQLKQTSGIADAREEKTSLPMEGS